MPQVGILHDNNCHSSELMIRQESRWIFHYFLIFQQKYMLWVLIRSVSWDTSNEYTQHIFSWRNKQNITSFLFLIIYDYVCLVTFTGVRIFIFDKNLLWPKPWAFLFDLRSDERENWLLSPKVDAILLPNQTKQHTRIFKSNLQNHTQV